MHVTGRDFAAKIRLANGELISRGRTKQGPGRSPALDSKSGAVVAAVEGVPKGAGMIGDIPIVTKVRPAGSRTLHVRFAGDRRAYVVALTGLIARSKHFAPLMEDADTFAKLDILDDGIGVAWPIETKWGRLDLSSSTPRGIAEEQLPMRGADFSKWRKSLGLSLTEAAKLLGVSRRTIMAYLKKNELPPVVAIACRALARDKHLLARTTCRHELFIISPEPANHSISDRIPVSCVTRARPS